MNKSDVQSNASTSFSKGFRGYNMEEVDNFLDKVNALLRQVENGELNTEQIDDMIDPYMVRNVRFRQGFRGYNTADVDIFLDKVKRPLGKFVKNI